VPSSMVCSTRPSSKRTEGVIPLSFVTERLKFIEPQLATAVDHAPPRAGWIHEVKHDGYRTLLIIERRKARAYTRSGFDWTDRYSGIINAAAKLDCRSAIIDGEIIIQNKSGVSDFESLKSAIRWRPQSLIFCAFDLLHLNGKDLRERPLLERRAKLKELVPTEHHFCSVKSSLETLPRSSKHVRIISLRALSPNSLRQNTEADAARLGSRRNASLKARSSSSAPPVIARQKLHWRCWLRLMHKV
jgi:ATP-dependent DNA ligase